MADTIKLTLRALSYLLRYPSAEMRSHLHEVSSALHMEQAIGQHRLAALDQLIKRLQTGDLQVEAEYVELFDRGYGTALHLFEHIHGDSRDRGPAMIDLIKTYEQAGLLTTPDELPDYLPLVLEYSSTQPASAARAFISEFAHLLHVIEQALQKRNSDYAFVLDALINVAGISTKDLPTLKPREESLDESWQEPAAFDGCSTKGQAATNAPQPIHLMRRQASSGKTSY